MSVGPSSKKSSTLTTALLTWASMATILAGWLWWTRPEPIGPLELLPDDGLEPGGSLVAPDEALSSRTVLPLGETHRVGNVEITPVSIERKSAVSLPPGEGENPIETEPVLVLRLKVKNVSPTQIFAPSDPKFLYPNEKIRPKGKDIFGARGVAYTFIHRADDLSKAIVSHDLVWQDGWRFQGQNFAELKPGQEGEICVISDPQAIEFVKGSCVWRVKLRTGLNKSGKGVATVVGIPFEASSIKVG